MRTSASRIGRRPGAACEAPARDAAVGSAGENDDGAGAEAAKAPRAAETLEAAPADNSEATAANGIGTAAVDAKRNRRRALRNRIIAIVCAFFSAAFTVRAAMMMAAGDGNWSGGVIPILGLAYIAWRIWPRPDEEA